MTDQRKHRGPHPSDRDLFSPDQWPRLQAAVADLGWLFDRGYASDSSLKLVGDRYSLRERQRAAVRRSTCSQHQLQQRQASRLEPRDVTEVWIDGFNLLTTVEAALSGGVILRGRDGLYRDMASMHGTYRRVEETRPALQRIANALSTLGINQAHWLLDQPVSNSGRLAQTIRALADEFGWNWTVELVRDPDRDLMESDVGTVITADSLILDHANSWLHIIPIILTNIDDVWLVPMSPE